jgi:hypothetical protein
MAAGIVGVDHAIRVARIPNPHSRFAAHLNTLKAL